MVGHYLKMKIIDFKSNLVKIKYLYLLAAFIFLVGCTGSIPHQDFIDNKNKQIGYLVNPNIKPYKYKNAGELWASDFALQGQGLTHITKNSNGNMVLHWSDGEILNTRSGEMVGKCLTYQVIDSKTNKIIDWGFDKGGNPKSCIAWWP